MKNMTRPSCQVPGLPRYARAARPTASFGSCFRMQGVPLLKLKFYSATPKVTTLNHKPYRTQPVRGAAPRPRPSDPVSGFSGDRGVENQDLKGFRNEEFTDQGSLEIQGLVIGNARL